MDLPLSDLPDDVDALKAMVLALAREQAAKEVRLKVAEAEIARLEAVEKSANERIANLTLIMKVLQRTQNGKRSERLRLGSMTSRSPLPSKRSKPAYRQSAANSIAQPRTSRSERRVRVRVLPPISSASKRSSSRKSRPGARGWQRF